MKEKTVAKKESLKLNELSEEEVAVLLKLVDKKLGAIIWVLENKQPENVEELEKNAEVLRKIEEKLKK